MKFRKKQSQKIIGNGNQVAGRDIVNTQVLVDIHLPDQEYPDAWCSEIERHREFKKEVGIDCSYPARRQICHLLTWHNFTPRQIKVAWKNNTLVFDDEKRCLTVTLSRAEVALGMVILLVGLLTAAIPAFLFVVTPNASGAALPAIAVIVVMAALIAREFIEPNRIGRRLLRVMPSRN